LRPSPVLFLNDDRDVPALQALAISTNGTRTRYQNFHAEVSAEARGPEAVCFPRHMVRSLDKQLTIQTIMYKIQAPLISTFFFGKISDLYITDQHQHDLSCSGPASPVHRQPTTARPPSQPPPAAGGSSGLRAAAS